MNINNLTKKELLIKCEELGIIKCKSKNKTELINLINNNIKIEHEIDDISDKIIKENNYYIGDNIELLKNIDDEIVDLIYFDPPYNTGRNFYDFNDKFKSKDEYIQFIKLRISECNRILKKSGTLVIHIEPKISHYFRFICDEIFGDNNFDFFNRYVGKHGELLSGGQKQIIHIIRSIINKNILISIYDEPTSAIDEINKNKIINLIKNKNKDNIVFIISHDDIKTICNKIITLIKS